MTVRTQREAPAERSLPRSVTPVTADHLTPAPPIVAPTSTLESAMHLFPEQLVRNHMEQRQAEAEASRIRRVALAARRADRAARRAESAERRARLARESAVLAARDSSFAAAR